MHKVLKKLHGKLWHTTSKERYEKILECGFICPEPNIPDNQRWKASRGPDFYPYVRTLGGVSLFDFHAFDPNEYDKLYPLSSWQIFIPYRDEWGHAIWIEIDRSKIQKNFIDGQALIRQWKIDGAQRHTIMPIIESAHIGQISKENFIGAFLVNSTEITHVSYA